MAVKAKNRKKKSAQENYSKAIKIKCCYCDIKGNCKNQAYKEKSEGLGFTTLCTLTPNVPKKQRKKKSNTKANS